MTEKSMRGGSVPDTLPKTVSTSAQISVCPSCGHPRDLAAFEHCDLCRQALRDENDREAKVIRDRAWNEAVRREHADRVAIPDPLNFEKVQEATAQVWSEFTATEDFRNRLALAQEIEILNAEGGP